MQSIPTSAGPWKRFWIYQSERFPFLAHGPLVLSFAFSAASYSRMCRGVEGFPSVGDVLVGGLVALGLFFLLRLADEWKDRHEDARWRPYRPVPRGLVTFGNLALWAGVTVSLQVVSIGLFRTSLWIWTLPALAWLVAMSFEFGVGNWLRNHPFLYAASHMAIMPLLDLFSTAIDWHAQGHPPAGVEIFLVLSYLNGFVLEIGRKVRAQEDEEQGVQTYSSLLGARRAAALWLAVLSLTAASALAACLRVGAGPTGLLLLALLAGASAFAGFRFLRQPGKAASRRLEQASALWSLGMYLVVGAAPALARAWGA